eukprot:CAMPEP_0113281092 /NCGR_PEP_ID=MMETSP0008_2-20120614/28107_1 /TAXON_ID=97485 /ORGANISM="Prymnesium parvum" /LENGTH=96 /DNA_ID=CAMNT_0000131467 /DNA_START=405 /DNA_END=695 /DNA_ORIENTATION=- /assembly_acc=CAM_ASM_000153
MQGPGEGAGRAVFGQSDPVVALLVTRCVVLESIKRVVEDALQSERALDFRIIPQSSDANEVLLEARMVTNVVKQVTMGFTTGVYERDPYGSLRSDV